MTAAGIARAALPFLMALFLMALFQGCGEEPSTSPPIRGERVLISLAFREDLRTVVHENESFPVLQDQIRPRRHWEGESGPLPALEMTPPCEVIYHVPPVGAGARLELAATIAQGHYRGRGTVSVRAEWDGELVHEWTLPHDPDVPVEERRWRRTSLELPAEGGSLTLSSTWDGEGPRPPAAAVGILEVRTPFEVPRLRASRDQPNVLLIVIDTQRADRLHCYGYDAEVSPALDAFAERGTLFERALVPTPWTSPSTASILTGITPAEHGLGLVGSNYLADGVTTLAEVFQARGFTTAGLSTNPLVSNSQNFDQGFETFEQFRWKNGETIYPDLEARLRGVAQDRFFLYLHFTDPHDPYAPAPEFAERFAGPAPEGFERKTPNSRGKDLFSPSAEVRAIAREHVAYDSKLYDAEIRSVDRTIERVFALLAELDLEEKTLVVVTADHGEEFLDHGYVGHNKQFFDESVHVPLIIAGPGVARGRRIATTVETRFTAPTLLLRAGVPVPEGMPEVDLLDDEQRERRASEPIFFVTAAGWWVGDARSTPMRLEQLRGVQLGSWRLIWSRRADHTPGRHFNALFDLERDPGMLDNLAQREPERVEELQRLVTVWLNETKSRRMPDALAGRVDRELLRELGYVGDDDAE